METMPIYIYMDILWDKVQEIPPKHGHWSWLDLSVKNPKHKIQQ